MKKIILMSCLACSLVIAGCETLGGQKQTIGTGVGALLGGLAGSQVGGGSGQLWATGAGVLLGALVGSEVGNSLDKSDLMYAERANTKAYNAPIGETITWDNPETGNHGEITPVKNGKDSTGRYCREYQQEITVGGQKQTAYGTACQQPDGSWEII